MVFRYVLKMLALFSLFFFFLNYSPRIWSLERWLPLHKVSKWGRGWDDDKRRCCNCKEEKQSKVIYYQCTPAALVIPSIHLQNFQVKSCWTKSVEELPSLSNASCFFFLFLAIKWLRLVTFWAKTYFLLKCFFMLLSQALHFVIATRLKDNT
jgi:hypothetical protein